MNKLDTALSIICIIFIFMLIYHLISKKENLNKDMYNLSHIEDIQKP